MRYFNHYDNLKFYKEPKAFDKHTDQETLKWAIGANMYMPSTKENILEKLINNTYREIGAITFCLEDAIPVSDVQRGEENIIQILRNLYDRSVGGRDVILMEKLPLIFIRVRNIKQFRKFVQKLGKKELSIITGFNFPKFNSTNGCEYFSILEETALLHDEILYGMPILEDKNIIYQETRISELISIQKILKQFSRYVLNIRVGGTDFSSLFGLRRDVKYTIWDIRTIASCLTDILNIFLRQDENYVISGPVWEYFSWDENSSEIKGLKKELMFDIQNGMQGKTIIHPSQIDTVNQSYIVDYYSYKDAAEIIRLSKQQGGVFKSAAENRMNEVNPHINWAKKILARADIFGVADQTAKF